MALSAAGQTHADTTTSARDADIEIISRLFVNEIAFSPENQRAALEAQGAMLSVAEWADVVRSVAPQMRACLNGALSTSALTPVQIAALRADMEATVSGGNPAEAAGPDAFGVFTQAVTACNRFNAAFYTPRASRAIHRTRP